MYGNKTNIAIAQNALKMGTKFIANKPQIRCIINKRICIPEIYSFVLATERILI